MRSRVWAVVLLIPPTLLLKGCGADETKDGANEAEAAKAEAVKGSYQNWQSVELKNGLVSVQVVPELGGRAMGFEFGGRALLYANPQLLGHKPGEEFGEHTPWVPGTSAGEQAPPEPQATHEPGDAGAPGGDQPPRLGEPAEPRQARRPAGLRGVSRPAPRHARAVVRDSADETAAPTGSMPEAEQVTPAEPTPTDEGQPLKYVPSPQSEGYANYGGAQVWPGPQNHWKRSWPPPIALDLGRYAPTLPLTDGEAAEVALASPVDEELGVSFQRTLTLYRASTVFRAHTELRNNGERTRTWSIFDVSQHPGALTPGETFTSDVQVYLPLNPASHHNLGFAALLGPQAGDQYEAEETYLKVSYLGQETLCGADSYRGWVAYADRRHEVVMVKLAHLSSDRAYPDRDLTSTVYTSPSDAESYVQMTLRSPLAEVEPGGLLTFNVWYGAAHCPLPIVDASPVGVVNQPLTAQRLGDSVQLQGIFGVFYAGSAQVAFYNSDGELLAKTEPVTVTPTQAFRLDTVASLPDSTVRVALLINNHRRVETGELSSCAVTEVQPVPAEKLAVQPEQPEAKPEPAAPEIEPTGGRPQPGEPAAPMPTAGEVGEPQPVQPRPEPAQPTGPEPLLAPAPGGGKTVPPTGQ